MWESGGFVMTVFGALSMETGHRATVGPRQGPVKGPLTSVSQAMPPQLGECALPSCRKGSRPSFRSASGWRSHIALEG